MNFGQNLYQWFLSNAQSLVLLVMVLGICGFANMWLAVFADVGVAMLAILNAMRAMKMKQ